MTSSVKFALALISAALLGQVVSAKQTAKPNVSSPATQARQEKTDYFTTLDTKEIPGFQFNRFFVTDKFGRRITCYLSKATNTESDRVPQKLPLVISIQGSGSQSIFQKIETSDGKQRIVSGGPEAVIRKKYSDRVRVLVVEKPGVEFLVQPRLVGGAEEASKEYNREFTLPRWVEALNACALSVLKMPNIDGTKVLALGHSEGGQVACELAAVNHKITNVAVMAGGGPNQLFDFMQMARSGEMYDPNATPQQRVEMLLADWKKVVDTPAASDKFVMGHSHLRWSTFLKSSPIQALTKSRVKVFIAQGTRDANSLPASADMLYAELLARGRDVTYERVEGGDHSFMKEGDMRGEGWVATNSKAIEWFLN